jgi:hypothetical protein
MTAYAQGLGLLGLGLPGIGLLGIGLLGLGLLGLGLLKRGHRVLSPAAAEKSPSYPGGARALRGH